MTRPTASLRRALVTRPAGRPSIDDLGALGREHVLLHREADEPLLLLALREVLERELPDEVVLVQLRQPGHVRRVEVRLRVRVLADDDVALLEAEHTLRLEAERPRALSDEPSQRCSPAGLGKWSSYPSSPTKPIRSASVGTPATTISFASRYLNSSAETSRLPTRRCERLARLRAGEVHGGERASDVHDLRLVAPDGVPPLEPGSHRVRAGGGRRDVEEVVGESRDRPVVHDPPAVRGEDAVADPAGLHVAEAVRVEALEESHRLGPFDEAACRASRRRSRRATRGRRAPRPRASRRRHRAASKAPPTGSSRLPPRGASASSRVAPE